jgi:hypothetical protein
VSHLPGQEKPKLRHTESYIFQAGRLLPALFLCLILLTAMPAAAAVVVGLPADIGQGNIYPFSGGYEGSYQELYSHTAFSGPIAITGLEF